MTFKRKNEAAIISGSSLLRSILLSGGLLITLVFMYLELNSTFLFLEFKLFIVIERYPFNVQQAC